MTAGRPRILSTRRQPSRERGDVFSGIANLSEEGMKVVAAYQEKIVRCLHEITLLDGLPRLSYTHTLPFQMLKYSKRIMDLYDNYTQFLLSHLRRCGFTVKCKQECPNCCYNMPTEISIIELIYVYDGMRRSDVADRYFRRCLEANELWSGILSRFTSEYGSPSERGEVREKALSYYQSLERPCPFLRNGACQIYPYRPFACRMHFSLSPPHWCHPSHFQHPHALAFNLQPGKSLTAALERLDKTFKLGLSDIFVCGLLELTVNVMEFDDIRWLN